MAAQEPLGRHVAGGRATPRGHLSTCTPSWQSACFSSHNTFELFALAHSWRNIFPPQPPPVCSYRPVPERGWAVL